MRAIIQRVNKASVLVENKIIGKIEKGLLVLVGFEDKDDIADLEWMSKKIINLRIFSDEQVKMNLSVKDINGEIMIVSQFTLHASTKKGNRPSFISAAKPEISVPLYNDFIKILENEFNKKIETGIFGAHMKVNLENEGPVTIFIDTKNKE